MLRSQIAKEKLKKLINNLTLAGSNKLPPERSLAKELSFSRSTIVKVLCELESEGIVTRKIGSGTFINEKKNQENPCFGIVMRRAYYKSDDHFRKIIETISNYAKEFKVNIKIFDNIRLMFAQDPIDNELLKAIKNKDIQGVLIISRLPLSITCKLAELVPTVAINNIFGDGSEIQCISCDYFKIGFLAGKYLLENGHKKIAFITDELNHPEACVEYSGFQSILENNSISFDEKNILETNQNAESIIAKTKDFFQNFDYTACFIRNPFLIRPFMQSLKENGIQEKLEIVITGKYENYNRRGWKLKVIDNKLDEMCYLGLKYLIQLNQDIIPPKQKLILLKPELT
jgi:DNA-binding LacI/PurR family transcriptional regulator